MTFLLDIINGINKFLGYLDISPKYLNRGYTLLSIFPTAYILRIAYGSAVNKNYLQFALYSLAFLVLLYFIVLNLFYYFFDKNVKGDVTQLFVKYLPDEAFNIQGEAVAATEIDHLTTEKVAVDFQEDYQLILADYLSKLIAKEELPVNQLENDSGFKIAKNTLYPYYFIKQKTATDYVLQIGTSYSDLVTIGTIKRPENAEKLEPVGLFIIGGDFVKDGVRYHEPYRLKLYAKKEDTENLTRRSDYRRTSHKK